MYKAGKTNVNADALSRNPVNFTESFCKIINNNRIFNPNNPEDAEAISTILEESDEEDEEDEDFKLYYSDDENLEDLLPDDNSTEESTATAQLLEEKEGRPQGSQIIEKALVHNSDNFSYNRIQT